MGTVDGVVSGSRVVKWGWKPGSTRVVAIMDIRRTTVDAVEEQITLKRIFVARGGLRGTTKQVQRTRTENLRF